MEFKKAIPRKIEITPTHNGGFIVYTGCCTLCFEDNTCLINGLAAYLANPEIAEQRYNEMQTRCGGAVITEDRPQQARPEQGEDQRTEAVPQPAIGRGGRGV